MPRGHMVSEPGRRGNDLIVYAVIAELCQLMGAAEVTLSHLTSWAGSSRSTVRRAIRRFEKRGLETAFRYPDEEMSGAERRAT